jgi:hypothetical protein
VDTQIGRRCPGYSGNTGHCDENLSGHLALGFGASRNGLTVDANVGEEKML